MGFDGDKKFHRHPERQRRIQGRRCEISYKVCKACHPGLEPVPNLFRDAGVNFLTLRAIPASAGMTSWSLKKLDVKPTCYTPLCALAIASESRAVGKQSQHPGARNYVIVKPTCYTCWDYGYAIVLHSAVGK